MDSWNYMNYQYYQNYSEENIYWNFNTADVRFEDFQQVNGGSMARQGAISLEEILKNKISKFRRWKQTSACKKHPRWGFQFSVMTYNILSQTALDNHRYLYRHCHEAFLQEDYRISRILPEILNSKSDIVCLQEVEQHLFDHRIKQLFGTVGFESIFKRRTGNKSDGCAILWRKEKFNLLKHSEVEFRVKGSKYLKRDNVGLIAVLKPNHPDSCSTQLHVATTHLIFNPKRGEIKLCQLRMLLAELERLSLKEVIGDERIYHPTILCGDFNVTPASPLCEFIETGAISGLSDRLSGDMSGQPEGKNRGQRMNYKMLSLEKLGINEFTRYEFPVDKQGSSKLETGETASADSTNLPKDNNTHNNCDWRPTAELDDPGILAAIGTSKDPRWITTLQALGQDQLAAELSSRINSKSNGPNENDVTDTSSSSDEHVNIEYTSDNARFSHDFKFVPVYKFHRYSEREMPITSMVGNTFLTVDNIFYNVRKKVSSDVFTEGELSLLGSHNLMRVDEIKELGGLPNACLGSDHLALIGQFGLCSKK